LHALTDLWRSDRAVCAFSQLHPLLENNRLFPAARPPQLDGQTVSIDLARPPLEIWRGYRRSLRYDIRAARATGVALEEDGDLRHLGDFSDLYRETMSRNAADPGYLFGYEYFLGLFRRLGGNAHLMTACYEGRLIGGAIFVACEDLLQYHFSATAADSLHHSPAKLLLDEIRLWGQARDYRVLHLGGGRGSRSDSLFCFKAGFSPRRHAFYTWRSVLEPSVYQELSAVRRREALEAGHGCEGSFFPLYRSPYRFAATPAVRS
jgi:lipid II:glycine glycyltransferase (peptidoglycan interpeptide bridge formation enzyme)